MIFLLFREVWVISVLHRDLLVHRRAEPDPDQEHRRGRRLHDGKDRWHCFTTAGLSIFSC